jgi:hypothetical protein
MRFELPFAEDDIIRARAVPITPKLLADAQFEGIRAAFCYWVFHLKAVIQGLLDRKPREDAILGLFYRAMGYVASIRRLNAPIHFQAIASAARSLFELGLDMAFFNQEKTDDSLGRIPAFTTVERYRVAKKIKEFYANRPARSDHDLSVIQAHVTDSANTARVEALVEKYWGRTKKGELIWPKHWSAFPNTRDRAHRVGGPWEERYVLHYYKLSWYMHSGLTGVAGIPKDLFDVLASEAFQLSKDVILDCYRIVGEELQLASAIPDWISHLHFLEHVVGMALVDGRLQALNGPARLLYLEPHEREPDFF